MFKIIKNMNLGHWLLKNTLNCSSVIELGAGFFDKLQYVNPNCLKIGIEIHQPYIDHAEFNDCIKIQGNLLNYPDLCKDYEKDCAIIIDVLEHFEMDIGYKMIAQLKLDFNKILLNLPVGRYVQNKDVTGYEGHVYQSHKSYWHESDIKKLEFDENIIDPVYHKSLIPEGLGKCYFGVWKKKI